MCISGSNSHTELSEDDVALRRRQLEVDQERRQFERRALDAGFHLAMKVRSYLTALDPHDPMLRNWVLRQMELELAPLAADVIKPIVDIEDSDFWEEHCYPRV